MVWRYPLLLLAVATLVFVATPVAAEPGNLAPTWQQEIAASESYLAGEQAKLQDARDELAEAEADGDSSFAESRRERVEDYEERVAAAQAQVTAAQAGLRQQNQLDEAGEPQDRLREIKESIAYYETLRDESQKAGATGTVELAVDDLQGGVFGNGLYEQQKDAEKLRAAKEAVTPGETTGSKTVEETNEETNETTAAVPAPGGGAGGENQPVEKPEPTPDEPEPKPTGNSGPGIGGLLQGVNLVPILAFIGLVAVAVFALAKSGGMNIREYFSLRGFFGPAMAERKKKPAPKKPKKTPEPEKTKTKAATKPGVKPVPETPKIEAGPETPKPEEKHKEKPRPEPGEAGTGTKGTTAEELDELFDQAGHEDELPDDEEPPG